MVYMITYDLNAAGQNYDDVISAIKSASNGQWCTYWKSSFLIKSSLSPRQIVTRINPYLDSNDRLIVIEVKNSYDGWLTSKQWDFIRNML